MEPLDLLVHAADTLSKMQVRYLVTGSMATITYGEARFTNDVDMVADLQARHIPQLLPGSKLSWRVLSTRKMFM